jgi:hypothetical protein
MEIAIAQTLFARGDAIFPLFPKGFQLYVALPVIHASTPGKAIPGSVQAKPPFGYGTFV